MAKNVVHKFISPKEGVDQVAKEMQENGSLASLASMGCEGLMRQRAGEAGKFWETDIQHQTGSLQIPHAAMP